MSYQAMSWAVGIKTGSLTLKAVLMALANYADEEGSCFPGQGKLAEELETSRRTVMRAMEVLEERGIIRRERRHRDDGSRTSDRIHLCMQASGLSDNLSPRGSDQVTLETRPSDKACHSRTIRELPDNTPLYPPKGGPRGSRVPEDFEPDGTAVRLSRELGVSDRIRTIREAFMDHWAAKAGKDGVKLDWQAAFRTWLRNEVKFSNRRNGNGHHSGQSAERTAEEQRKWEIYQRHLVR